MSIGVGHTALLGYNLHWGTHSGLTWYVRPSLLLILSVSICSSPRCTVQSWSLQIYYDPAKVTQKIHKSHLFHLDISLGIIYWIHDVLLLCALKALSLWSMQLGRTAQPSVACNKKHSTQKMKYCGKFTTCQFVFSMQVTSSFYLGEVKCKVKKKTRVLELLKSTTCDKIYLRYLCAHVWQEIFARGRPTLLNKIYPTGI